MRFTRGRHGWSLCSTHALGQPLLHLSRRILIGIAGGSGSAKTLVARTIVRELGSKRVVIIDRDSDYKDLEDVPFRDREARNFDPPCEFDGELLRKPLRDLLEGPRSSSRWTTAPSTGAPTRHGASATTT